MARSTMTIGAIEAMKVAIVVADGLEGKGGIEKIMTYLVRSLKEERSDIAIAIQQTRFGSAKLVRHLSSPLALVQFVARCGSERFDLVHINVAPRGSTWRKMFYARVARAFGIPVLLHLHGSGYDDFFNCQNAVSQRRIRSFFQKADHVVVLGKHWRDFARDGLLVEPSRISVIENGTPRPEGLAKPAAKVPVIVFFGQTSERKGIDVLLEALSKLVKRGMDLQMRIGGDGNIDHWRGVAESSGISEHVKFLGWVDEATVDREMRAADVFVLPSRAENQPVAILEAMARGLPVVSTDIGAIPETVVDGQCGLIVPRNDSAALAQALSSLLEDPAKRIAMGNRGRKRWEENFSIASTARKMSSVYENLAKSKLSE